MNIPAAPKLALPKSLAALFAGAGGGLLSFFAGEIFHALTDNGPQDFSPADFGQLLEMARAIVLGSALWSGIVGLTIGLVILVFDNLSSLRGQWHRNLWGAVPLFFCLSFLGGAAGQLAYFLIQNSLTRGIGWSLMGASIGVGIGVLRRDSVQSRRGALGGALGGFGGGFLFDGLAHVSDAGGGAFSRLVGQILMGALIAGLMQVVQDALKDAYLLGVSTGPYEGKEYPLNTARVSVGRASDNDISLFREETAPLSLGALVFGGGNWRWQGQAVPINGTPQSSAILASGDTLQLGATNFRFKTRAGNNAPLAVPNPAPHPASHPAPRVDANAPQNPVATAPKAPVSASPPNSSPAATLRVAPRFFSAKTAPQTGAALLQAPDFVLLLGDGQKLSVPRGDESIGVGRAVQNALVLADAGVSSSHATLQIAGGRLWLCDLSSTNGTFVNGEKIAPQTPTALKIGDRVRFGKLETTVVAG